MRTRSNDVSPIAGARVASPTALDAGRSPTAPCGEAPTLMSSQAIAFLSPEPASGKSRALEVSDLLVPDPVHAVNVTGEVHFLCDPAGAA